jgi:hypothetical protein
MSSAPLTDFFLNQKDGVILNRCLWVQHSLCDKPGFYNGIAKCELHCLSSRSCGDFSANNRLSRKHGIADCQRLTNPKYCFVCPQQTLENCAKSRRVAILHTLFSRQTILIARGERTKQCAGL